MGRGRRISPVGQLEKIEMCEADQKGNYPELIIVGNFLPLPFCFFQKSLLY
jgi:hypothetical protein